MADAILGNARFVTVRVADWPAAVRYYGEVLGLMKKFSDDPNQYAMFEAGPIRIAIEGPARPAHRREGNAGAIMLNFQVDNLESTVGKFKNTGVKVVSDIRHGPGYDYVAISDPEGNEHIVFQRKPQPA